MEGRLPEKAGECLVDEDFLSYTDLKVGDTVTFHSGDGEALTGFTGYRYIQDCRDRGTVRCIFHLEEEAVRSEPERSVDLL